MYIDTHTHLHHKKFNPDRAALLGQMKSCGIEDFIEIPIGFQSNYDMREKLSGNHHFAVGVHPSRVAVIDLENHWKELKRFAALENTVAIGETGLDLRIPTYELQEKYFHVFIDLADEFHKPLILHLRGEEVYEKALEILRKRKRTYRGVVHCFTGNAAEADAFIRLGFCLGIGGMVTYEEETELRSAVKETDLQNIVLETDSPFLRPSSCMEEKRNTPLGIPIIAEEIASLKGVRVDEVAEVTTQNAKEIFDI